MLKNWPWLRRTPGYLALGAMLFVTYFWSYWGVAELYHEGWWGAWYNRLPYLAPGAGFLLLTLAAWTWPFVGAGLIAVIMLAFVLFFEFPLAFIPVIFVIGAGFVLEGLERRRRLEAGIAPSPRWWVRNLGYLLALVPPLCIAIGISAFMLPIVLTRVDDGDRSARLIEGNGVTLVWAPAGPGWNWKQPWGGYPSWQRIALYGYPPVGLEDKPGYDWRQGEFADAEDMATYNLCRYLSADGLTLEDEIVGVWRMPTTEEVVASLARHGENAGCVWQGEVFEQLACDVRPDKESPLWAADAPVIYYWTAGEDAGRWGVFVSYNGYVNSTLKTGGNPRHGYRCVREP
ncbi:MAG: hypothetical protein JXB35_09655 [Anaerolineae bacterium]|nr:hypothetical protein [Anaerolineae bacterium]